VFSVGCLFAGHDDMVVREAGRMWLRCQHCGRDTPGWTVGRAAAVTGQLQGRCDMSGAACSPSFHKIAHSSGNNV
jgi:hypothetical protein